MDFRKEDTNLASELSRKHQVMLERVKNGSETDINEALNELKRELKNFTEGQLAKVIENELNRLEKQAISKGKKSPAYGEEIKIFETHYIRISTPKKYEALRPIFDRNDILWWRSRFLGRTPYVLSTMVLLSILVLPLVGFLEATVFLALSCSGTGLALGPTLRGKLLGSPISELNRIGEILRVAGFEGFVTSNAHENPSFVFQLWAFYNPEEVKLN